jgi:hypothetical protein
LGHWRILGNRLFKIKMIRKLEFVLGILDCWYRLLVNYPMRGCGLILFSKVLNQQYE